jgi:hypothetical protein
MITPEVNDVTYSQNYVTLTAAMLASLLIINTNNILI